jgi:hypothetical protein
LHHPHRHAGLGCCPERNWRRQIVWSYGIVSSSLSDLFEPEWIAVKGWTLTIGL